eukprot:m.44607 g.44607  ORF g.44607 m.44607 type:complete len:373 (-) comp6546_c0_seq1:148-1266(-)
MMMFASTSPTKAMRLSVLAVVLLMLAHVTHGEERTWSAAFEQDTVYDLFGPNGQRCASYAAFTAHLPPSGVTSIRAFTSLAPDEPIICSGFQAQEVANMLREALWRNRASWAPEKPISITCSDNANGIPFVWSIYSSGDLGFTVGEQFSTYRINGNTQIVDGLGFRYQYWSSPGQNTFLDSAKQLAFVPCNWDGAYGGGGPNGGEAKRGGVSVAQTMNLVVTIDDQAAGPAGPGGPPPPPAQDPGMGGMGGKAAKGVGVGGTTQSATAGSASGSTTTVVVIVGSVLVLVGVVVGATIAMRFGSQGRHAMVPHDTDGINLEDHQVWINRLHEASASTTNAVVPPSASATNLVHPAGDGPPLVLEWDGDVGEQV